MKIIFKCAIVKVCVIAIIIVMSIGFYGCKEDIDVFENVYGTTYNYIGHSFTTEEDSNLMIKGEPKYFSGERRDEKQAFATEMRQLIGDSITFEKDYLYFSGTHREPIPYRITFSNSGDGRLSIKREIIGLDFPVLGAEIEITKDEDGYVNNLYFTLEMSKQFDDLEDNSRAIFIALKYDYN